MILRRLSLAGMLCATVALSACGAAYGWSHASTLNTIAAYQTFLSKYPNNPHAGDARSRIAAFKDGRAWTTAQIASSIQGYQQYLRTEPNGTHARVAREEIVTRERDAAWQTARTNETAQSLRAFINKYPSSAEADEARDRLKLMAGYPAEFETTLGGRRADCERHVSTKPFDKDLRQVVARCE
jgi:outer membrane protein assembly factor BamD (BamD/ComL family)